MVKIKLGFSGPTDKMQMVASYYSVLVNVAMGSTAFDTDSCHSVPLFVFTLHPILSTHTSMEDR